ncbi:hypothetical protein [Synechococcus sp. CCY9202]|jgi:hypothetical protein|uniref:hypothetical protein n=1 Tax=Synechococcus sp. CCY9202 TaxID=174698 RepID=UPI002B21E167|nr:hypothetical protein [Synechococcus sp. CCY9202]MEA5424737.1 hypothetical protein [Synechococcus sp. CCY9202]
MTSTTISSATPIDPRTGWVLLHKDEQEIYVWAVHASGWQALGWSVGSAAVLPAEPEPEPPMEPEEPDPEDPGPESQPADRFPDAPESNEEPEASTTIEADVLDPAVAMPDFAAMTKAEIIEHCSSEYGVLLDASLTKSALIGEAEALAAAAPLPDALMDDLMT